jgi:diaminopropionate ammonia-lyase
VAGESGAAGCGAFLEIMKDGDAKAALGINSDSVILCISSEGDTDKENYQRIVMF